MTTYTGRYNLPTIKRGDTLGPWSVKASRGGVEIVPVSVCAQLKDEYGRVVIPMPFTIGLDGTITFEGLTAQVTRQLDPQLYCYDVEWTDQSGRVRTYLEGSLEIEGDISQCHAT